MKRLAGPPDNRDTVLAAIGRASTPPVENSQNGPSLGSLTRVTANVLHGTVLLAGTTATANIIRQHRPFAIGVPGMLAEQASQTEIETFVIDSDAFDSGPWLNADDHQSRHLAEELFEAGRILRSRGGQCWLIPRPAPGGSMTERLRSTATADLGDIPAADYEEGAAQSPLWKALVRLATDRFLGASPHSAPQPDRKDSMPSSTLVSHSMRSR